jgi:hypothetical protein
MNFQEKLKNQFLQSPNQVGKIQGRGRDPLKINRGNRLLGVKPNRKFLGRNRSGRNKIKSKRRNNYKTFNARTILATKHAIGQALKKVDNKYVLTYGDIARLMRKYHYTYNKELRRWLTKAEKQKDKDDEDKKKSNSEPKDKTTVSKTHDRHNDDDSNDEEDDEPEDEIEPLSPEPFKLTPPEKKEKKPEKDRLKSLQARIVLISNGESNVGEYSIQPNDIQFTIPDNDVINRMKDKELLWLKNKDKWTQYNGKDPNPMEGYKGTLGRAILVDNEEYSFLDFEEADLDMVSEKMEDLGYEWVDGNWVNTEEQITEEAAGTSSTPANAGPGANSQGIAPFKARLGAKMRKRTFPGRTVI